MKRLVCIIVSLILCMSSFSVLSENMQVVTVGKNNIQLGMTKKEVRSLVSATQIETNRDWNFGTWDMLIYEDGYNGDAKNEVPGDILCSSTSFAGYNNCIMLYFFEKDILTSIVVVFSLKDTDKNAVGRQFSAIDDALKKYGKPIATGNDYVSFKTNRYDAIRALKERAFTKTSSGAMWYKHYQTSLMDSSQYLVFQGDNYVDIHLIEYNRNEIFEQVVTPWSSTKTTTQLYGVLLSYTLCEKAKVEAVINTGIEKQESLHNDL